MEKQELIIELQNIIADFLKSQGLELIELIYHYEGRDLYLRILTDLPEGGISVGECSRLNREISVILDELAMLQSRYILEVSSPGLDRPLKTRNDFLRCINRKAKFFFNTPVNGKLELDGLIIKLDGESLYIEIEGDIKAIPLSGINKAKQLI